MLAALPPAVRVTPRCWGRRRRERRPSTASFHRSGHAPAASRPCRRAMHREPPQHLHVPPALRCTDTRSGRSAPERLFHRA
eukprot:364588-Chlamydomonas_euryale.AAC.17